MKKMMKDFWAGLHPGMQGVIIALIMLHALPLIVVWLHFWWMLIL
jgi:hypothetical protein